jgi:hypothetical protein
MSKTTPFFLSAHGLRSANQISRKDFRFVSGSNAFVCDRFQAGFLSPRVTKLILTDPTIEEFSLQDSDSKSKCKIDMIESLLNSESLIVDEKNIEILDCLSDDLENVEMKEFVLQFVEKSEPLTISNCLTRLKMKLKSGILVSEEKEFIAIHISDIEVEDLRQIEEELIKDILRLKSLRIENEDWLIELIFNLGPSYSKLLGEVRFEFLTQNSIDFFFENFCIENLDSDIWHQIWLRSRHKIIYDGTEFRRENARLKSVVTRMPESPWSGLISYLSQTCDVHEKGLVEITCSAPAWNQCWEVVNYGWTDWFATTSKPNSWIQFDFKDRVISLTHYVLKSHSGHYHYLLQWTVQGSMDGNHWSALDDQNRQDLNGKSITKMFECHGNSPVFDFYRYIRFTQTGHN